MEEGIKKVEEKIKLWKADPRIMIQEENFKIVQAIDNLLKGYKGKTEALDKTLQEKAELRLEIIKKDTKITYLNKVLDKMAIHIVNSAVVDDTVCCLKCGCEDKECNYEEMLECTKQYFREEVDKI